MTKWLSKNNYIKNEIDIDNRTYEVFIKEKTRIRKEAARIIVVSFQPNKEASELLELCIKSIKKFTDADYELWIVDNNSPGEFIKWLDNVEDINIACIRTEPEGGASYANGLALEVAVRLVNPGTKYLVSLHEDVVVCRYGWLDYMLSKIDGKTRAAGFRLTRARVPEGVLHVCGYMIDFQVFKELKLSFLPELPEFDVGDKAIYELRKNGFGIFYTPNTFDNPDLIKLIPETMEVRNLNVTRSFNYKNEIIYMHLGRGIPKTIGEYRNKEKSSSKQWSEYIRNNLFSEPAVQFIGENKIADFDFSKFSIKEFYDLCFMEDILNLFPENRRVLYLGNKNIYLDRYRLGIEYMENMSFSTGDFDFILCPEIIKYTGQIEEFLLQSYKRLKNGGIFSTTMSSMSPEENQNSSGSGYSYSWLGNKLWELGYREVSVLRQGSVEVSKFLFEYEEAKVKNAGDLNRFVFNDRLVKKRLKNIFKRKNKTGNRKTLSGTENMPIGYGIKAVK